MSDVRIRESLLPGLGHLRRGHRLPATRFLVYAICYLAVLLGRMRTLPTLWGDLSLENGIGLAFLALFPVGLVLAAHRSLSVLAHPPAKEGMGTWRLAFQAFRKNSRGVWGLTILGLVYMVAFLCPVLAPYDPGHTPRDTIVNKYRPPFSEVYVFGDRARGEIYAVGYRVEGDALVLDRVEEFAGKRVPIAGLGEPRRGWSRDAQGVRTMRVGDREIPYRVEFHLLGTDGNGRDLLSRIIYGSRISLTIGFAAMLVAATLGVLFGAVAGYLGGVADGAIMRMVDILLAFPRLLLLLLIISVWEGAGIFTVVVVLGATGWMGVARLVRAEFLRLKSLDYAVAARALGLGRARIMFRHLLPNSMAPVIVDATLRVGNTILVEAALSFLGFGVTPPTATWGNIVSDGRLALHFAFWIATIPGLCIVLTVVCFNLVGDALRDALDPRLRQ